MGDLNQVINFCTFAYLGTTKARAVNRAVRSDLNIVAHRDVPHLRDLLVATLGKLVAKSVRPDHSAGLHANASPQHTLAREHNAWHQPAVVADAGLAADEDVGLKVNALTDLSPRLNHAQRPDRGGRGDPCPRRHHGRRMDARQGHGPKQPLDPGTNASQRDGGVFYQ